ncbi:MAG: GTP-binding protein, partial [Rhodospirillales bacterium]|nr:GTP-binding protein [Rhodospirillales bacterium]
MSLFDQDKSSARIPVSLVTGFLGSGKTTLLNRVLGDPRMARSLVLVNEFGEVGLDHLFMQSISGDMVLLQSGCVCCTIQGDLDKTLRNIARRRAKDETPPFDRVLLETTGLADPAPILQLLLNTPMISHDYRLDGVVATVDALNCQSAFNFDPRSASNVDPFGLRSLVVALAPTEPVGVAEAARARGCG